MADKVNKSTGIVKEVRHPFTQKLMKEVWVTNKGLYRRNSVYKTYNSVDKNTQLKDTDLNSINWNKCK